MKWQPDICFLKFRQTKWTLWVFWFKNHKQNCWVTLETTDFGFRFCKGDINTVGVDMFTVVIKASTVTVSVTGCTAVGLKYAKYYWKQPFTGWGRVFYLSTKETKPEMKSLSEKSRQCWLTLVTTMILRENMDVPELSCSLQPQPFVLSVLTIELLQRAWVNSL